MHQGSALLSFQFAVVVDVVDGLAGEGEFGRLLYAECLVLVGEAIKEFRNRLMERRKHLMSRDLKLALGKPEGW